MKYNENSVKFSGKSYIYLENAFVTAAHTAYSGASILQIQKMFLSVTKYIQEFTSTS